MKAFLMNDFDTVIANSAEEAKNWYINSYLEDPTSDPDIEERNLDSNKMWYPVSNEIISNANVRPEFIKYIEGDPYIYVTLRMAIEFDSMTNSDFKLPYLLCSTEI